MSLPPKTILFDQKALAALTYGISQVVEIAAITLGQIQHSPHNSATQSQITSDGSQIAQNITPQNPHENLGASMAKEMAAKIRETTKDGSTTGLLLLRALVVEGGIKIATGKKPKALNLGMEKALEALLNELKKNLSSPIRTLIEIKNIAKSLTNDPLEFNQEVETLLEKCWDEREKKTAFILEESETQKTTFKHYRSINFNQGYTSRYFCTHPEKSLAILKNPLIFITDQKIRSAQEIFPLLQTIAETNQELFILADDIDEEALSTLIFNTLKNSLIKVVAVNAPYRNEGKKEFLQKIASLTGANILSEKKDFSLNAMHHEYLGRAAQVIATKNKTTLFLDSSSPHKNLHESSVIIQIGAATASEKMQKKELFEKILILITAALEGGVVPGGGAGLLHAAQTFALPKLSKEELDGAELLRKACEAPFRQIVQNTGKNPSATLQEVLAKGKHFGFNAVSEQVENIFEAGIIDPVTIVENSLRHAVSMASKVLLTDTLIA